MKNVIVYEVSGKEKNGIVNRTWDFLASVKLAMGVFILIILTAVFDTFIKETVIPGESMQELARIFGEPTANEIYDLLESSGFTNVFHSHWFTGLLALLAANIIVCSINRLPGIIRLIKNSSVPFYSEKIDKITINKSLKIKGKLESVQHAIRSTLNSAGFRTHQRDNELSASSGAWSRLGVYVTHLSLLIIMSGAVIGIFYSLNCFLYLKEGDASHRAVRFSRSGKTEMAPLGFVIRNDGFEVDFYDGTDSPKSFRSKLAVIKDGREVLKKTISVNDPLTYEGVSFYQADYGTIPGSMGKGTFVFKVESPDGQSEEVRLRPGNELKIPGTSITGKVINFSPALANDEKGNLYTYADRLQNPAVQIEFSEKGRKLFTNWIFKRYPETWVLPDGSKVGFLDYWGVEYSFLLVRKDAGIWLIYSGLILMSAGLLIAFFYSHKRIRAVFFEEGETTAIEMYAGTNKKRGSLQKTIDRIVQIPQK